MRWKRVAITFVAGLAVGMAIRLLGGVPVWLALRDGLIVAFALALGVTTREYFRVHV